MMLDTSYVVDLLRERARGKPGPAIAFLDHHRSVKLRMPLFVLCELELGVERAGKPDVERRALESFMQYVEPVYPQPGYSVLYARTVAALLRDGTAIPVMDALVGTLSLQYSEPIVTRDVEHYRRISGLVVIDHRLR